MIFVLLQVAAASFRAEDSRRASYQAPTNASAQGLGFHASLELHCLYFLYSRHLFPRRLSSYTVGVLYSMLWEMSYVRMMQMEPFFQLTVPGGAGATDSLLLNYVSVSLPVVLYKSTKKAHRAVFWSSVVALVISISVPLASETLYISTTGTCSSTGDGSDCKPSLALRPALVRVEQALIGALFFIVAYLAIWYRRRQSGIYAEATSIAGVATLLQDPILLDDLRRIPPQASASPTDGCFKNKRYGLGYSSRRVGSSEYGLITLGGAPSGPSEKSTGRYVPVPSDDNNKHHKSKCTMAVGK